MRNKSQLIRADELKVHPLAQRKLVPSLLAKIMPVLDLDAIGTLHVVEKDNQLWIVDGQHRWTCLMRHGLGEWKVRVEIHVDAKDNDARASELFLRLNQTAVVGPFDKYLNELIAGDATAKAVEEISGRNGLEVHRVVGDGRVLCVTTLKSLYTRGGEEVLDTTLKIAVDAWGRTREAVEGKLLEGLGRVIAAHNGTLDRVALTKKLAKYPGGASGVLGDAKGLKRLRRSTLPNCVAEAIIEAYNSGRRGERLSVPK